MPPAEGGGMEIYMNKTKVGYIGSLDKIAEYIYQNEVFELDYILCEKESLTKELLTVALVRNIKLIEISEDLELEDYLNNCEVKIWVTCSYGKRIKIELLSEDIKIYNIHYALLPNYKGRHPTFWATMKNEKKIGITLHKVEKNFDQGKIVSQYSTPYYIWMNENDLFSSLTRLVPKLLNDLVLYFNDDIKLKENLVGNYYPAVVEKDYTIDLKKDTFTDIYNKVRCQSKYNGAKLSYNNKTYFIKKISFVKLQNEKKKSIIPINDNIGMLLEEYRMEEE